MLALPVLSQAQVQKGYYIDNGGTRHSCYLSLDVRRGANEFYYYKTEDQKERITISINKIQEFGINDEMRFVRHQVLMEVSNNANGVFKKDSNPEWENRTIFLEQVLEGKADLFYYGDSAITRYFYRVDDAPLKQLVYFKYLQKDEFLRENNQYKQDLLNILRCEKLAYSDFSSLSYTKSSLSSLFIRYNKCSNESGVAYKELKKRRALRVKVKTGATFVTLTASNLFDSNIAVNFGSQIKTPLIGFEVEYILPFKSNDWSLRLETIFSPAYEAAVALDPEMAEGRTTIAGEARPSDLALGLRKYFSLNEDFRYFLNAAFATTAVPTINYEANGNQLRTDKVNIPFRLGTGINYKRWELEFIYKTPVNGTFEFINSETEYKSFQIVVGYRI